MSQNPPPFNQPNPYGPQPSPGQQNPYGPQPSPGQQNPYGPQPSPGQQNLYGPQPTPPGPYGPQPTQPSQVNPYGSQNPPSGPQNTYPSQYTQPEQQNSYGSQPLPSNYPNPITPPPMTYMPPPSAQYDPNPQPPRQFEPPTYMPPPAQKPRRLSTPMLILAIVLIIVILGGGGALTYYSAVVVPNNQHAMATSTSSAKTAVVQSTSEARVHGTATAIASATAVVVATQTAFQNIYTQATSGTPTINDPLSQQDSYNWTTFGTATDGCAFSGGAYYSAAQPGYVDSCFARTTNFGDFAFQAEMTILNGQTGGILFHGDFSRNNYYVFRIGTDGTYNLNKTYTDSTNHINETPLATGSSPAIKQGANQTNLLAVVERGNTFYLYVNKKFVDTASNGDYTNGQIGVYSISNSGTPATQVMFRNVQAWKL